MPAVYLVDGRGLAHVRKGPTRTVCGLESLSMGDMPEDHQTFCPECEHFIERAMLRLVDDYKHGCLRCGATMALIYPILVRDEDWHARFGHTRASAPRKTTLPDGRSS